MKFTSVVGYHMSPLTCGVAKFNVELARRLGVPFMNLLDDYLEDMWQRPLWSLKWSELTDSDRSKIVTLPFQARWHKYSVFWHDRGHALVNNGAQHVFYADPSLGSPGLWCPSLLTSKPRPVRLFSFGMAHKLQPERFRTVRRLLAAAGLPYTLRVSIGLHEGTSLDGCEQHFDALKNILGESQVTILGCLSDDAVREELDRADVVLAFFERGLRANNTTVHAALEAGAQVITNHDEHTPTPLRSMTLNVDALTRWPHRQSLTDLYTWDRLIQTMDTLCEASRSTVTNV